tara:strand:- start:1698 stop:2606 length:909 start_codon:yes stop_codon:yes gene_type:complete
VVKLPSGIDINKLIQDLRVLSWEASDVLLHYSKLLKEFNGENHILKNDDKDNPVTLADLKVNEIIIQNIDQKYKNIPWEILSEENVKLSDGNYNSECDWIWILDPLDGTKDFIQGSGNYAMHLALNYKKKPILGIVLIPEKDELWFAYDNKVWCENKDGSKTKPKISKIKDLQEMTLVKSKNHGNKILDKLIKKIKLSKILTMGSIGCKIASIVRGESEIYISLSLPSKSSPKDWDLAAPEAILKASGGAITNLDNQDLSYGKSDFQHGGVIIASNNKENHKNICSQIKMAIKKYEIFPLDT